MYLLFSFIREVNINILICMFSSELLCAFIMFIPFYSCIMEYNENRLFNMYSIRFQKLAFCLFKLVFFHEG